MKITISTLLFMMTTVALSDTTETAIQQMVADDRARAVVVAQSNNATEPLVRSAGEFSGIPAASAVFEVGSVSKVFTSLLAQVLVDQGKTSWESTLTEVFPDLEFANSDVAEITLRELSTHTSGLPRLPDNMTMEDPMDPYAGYGDEGLFDYLGRFDPEALDKSYEYSNLGAGLLGRIAREVAGTSYQDAMQQYVFEPLDMQDSAVGLRDSQQELLVQGFSDGADMANWAGFDALAGAGAITSTIEDLRKFVAAHFGDSPISGSIKAILEPQGDGVTALGWHIEAHPDGDAFHWHNGGTGGYTSYLGIRTSDKSYVVILAASTEYGAVTELGMNLMTGAESSTSIDLTPYEGVFQIAEGFYLTIYVENDRLIGQATGQGALTLEHAGGDVFEFAPADITLDFNREADGDVPSIDYTQAGNSMTIPRVDDALGIQRTREVAVSPETLDDYAGQYQLAPGAVIRVFRRGDQLFAQLTGQTAYPVFAYDTDKFFYKVVDARLSFVRDSEGVVESVILDQGGQRIAPRIAE